MSLNGQIDLFVGRNKHGSVAAGLELSGFAVEDCSLLALLGSYMSSLEGAVAAGMHTTVQRIIGGITDDALNLDSLPVHVL